MSKKDRALIVTYIELQNHQHAISIVGGHRLEAMMLSNVQGLLTRLKSLHIKIVQGPGLSGLTRQVRGANQACGTFTHKV